MAKQKNRVISFFDQSQAETCKITQFPLCCDELLEMIDFVE